MNPETDEQCQGAQVAPAAAIDQRLGQPAPTTVAGKAKLSFLGGPGGARAVTAVAGALLVAEFAGIDWESIGGVSGGALPTSLFDSGLGGKAVVHLAVKTDFSSLLTRDRNYSELLRSYSLRQRYNGGCPTDGLYTTDKLSNFFDAIIPVWPKKFWTVALASDRSLIVFCARGVYRFTADGTRECLSETPVSMGTAICSTSAVPGVINAVPYTLTQPCQGVTFPPTVLFDGALGPQGGRPVDVPVHLFAANLAEIIVLDVGPEPQARVAALAERIWSLFLGSHCVPGYNAYNHLGEEHGLKLIFAPVTGLGVFEFNAPEDKKWKAVMTGISASVPTLAKHELLQGAKLEACQSAICAFQSLNVDAKGKGSAGLAKNIESILADHGLF